MKKKYTWGTEAPADREKRLTKILNRPRENVSIRYTRAEFMQQLNETRKYRQKKPRLCLESHIATVETLIYRITDASGRSKYIGKTTQTLEKRLREHHNKAIKGYWTNLSRWIRECIKTGQPFHIQLLEMVPAGKDWAEAERRWISMATEPLLNMTQGGEGAPGHKHTEKTRARLSDTTKAYMGQTAQRQAAALRIRGRKLSPKDVSSIRTIYTEGQITQRALAKQYKTTQPTISRALNGGTFAAFDLSGNVEASTMCRYKRRSIKDDTQVRNAVLRYVAGKGAESLETIGQKLEVSYKVLSDIICGNVYKDVISEELRASAKCVADDRHRKSERRKLSNYQAQLIRILHAGGRYSVRALAKEFEISNRAILNMIHNKTYRVLFITLPDDGM